MKHVADVLTYLRRPDKHYLGGGSRLLWAPLFPTHLDIPGLWDGAHYFAYEFAPLFTWTLLDDAGNIIPLRVMDRSWDPACLTQTYSATVGRVVLTVTESKCVLSNDVASCEISFRMRGSAQPRIHLVAWTAQENFPAHGASWVSEAGYRDGALAFFKHCRPADRPVMTIGTVFALSPAPRSYAVQIAEAAPPMPRWELSPFCEKFTGKKLPNTIRTTGVSDEGILFMALHTEIALAAGHEGHAAISFSVSPTLEKSRLSCRSVMKDATPTAHSAPAWNEYFGGVPRFTCSDERITRYYWYRWYGLRLNTITGVEGNDPYPTVCEGIGPLRAPVSSSAPHHILETRWRHDPALARGSLLTFVKNQRKDGETLHHADWGDALLGLHHVHPSTHFLRDVHEELTRYARSFDKERDREMSGLYDIDNPSETGQEQMHRFTADSENRGEAFRLKGVDATVSIYGLKRVLARVARELGRPGEAELWDIEADKIRAAVRTLMWDPVEEMFFDVDPVTGKRTALKAATCFSPYLTDMVTDAHVNGLKRHLLNPEEFWTPFPVPSVSVGDASFSAEPEWKGKRVNRPWNGRVWPMTNSQIVEALARSAIAFNDSLLRTKAGELIRTFIRMMFFDGDPSRPNCFEHYNPITGAPSLYRGIDDHQRSRVVDLIITYVCGIRPTRHELIVDPFPCNLRELACDDVIVQGHRVRVEIRKRKFTVWLDAEQKAEGIIGNALRFPLP